MIDFNPQYTLKPLDAFIAQTSDPKHLAILANFKEHLLAEIAGDVAAIMATQSAEPQYHFYGAGVGDTGPKGQQEVRAFYQNIFDQGYNKLRYDTDRFVVQDHALFHEGDMHIVFPGKALGAMGLEVDDSDAYYVYSYRQAAVFHYDTDGVCTGEDTYSDGPLSPDRLRKLTPQEIATLPPNV
jgi:hypothetical protein